VKSGAPEG